MTDPVELLKSNRINHIVGGIREKVRGLKAASPQVLGIVELIEPLVNLIERKEVDFEDTLFQICIWCGYARILSDDTKDIEYRHGMVFSSSQHYDLPIIERLRTAYQEGSQQTRSSVAKISPTGFIDTLQIQAYATAFSLGIPIKDFTKSQ